MALTDGQRRIFERHAGEYGRRELSASAYRTAQLAISLDDEIAALRTSLAERDAEVAALREALEPFVPPHFRDRGGDDMTGYFLEGRVIRLGDVRRAVAALSGAVPAPPTAAPLAVAERAVIGKHPLPWRLVTGVGLHRAGIVIEDANGDEVTEVCGESGTGDRDAAIGALIVAAVNAHAMRTAHTPAERERLRKVWTDFKGADAYYWQCGSLSHAKADLEGKRLRLHTLLDALTAAGEEGE